MGFSSTQCMGFFRYEILGYMYRIAGLFRRRLSNFVDLLAIRENIICEYCIAYKVWLIRKCNLRNFYSRNTLMPVIHETFNPQIKPAIWYEISRYEVHVPYMYEDA